MNQPLYGVWLGDVFFCFSGEMSEPRVDAWSRVIRQLRSQEGVRPFAQAGLRLAELRYPARTVAPIEKKRGEKRQLVGRTLEGLSLSAQQAYQLLLAWDEKVYQAQGVQPGAEMSYWVKIARFTLELMHKGRIAPGIAPPAKSGGARRRSGEQSVVARWKPQLSDPDDLERFKQLAASIPYLALGVPVLIGPEYSSREEAGAAVIHSFMSAVIHAEVQEAMQGMQSRISKYTGHYRRGYSPLAELWWSASLTASREIMIQGPNEEIEQLTEEVATVGGTALPLLWKNQDERKTGTITLGLRLEPGNEPRNEGELQRWVVSFWAELQDEYKTWLPARIIWGSPEKDLYVRGWEYFGIQEQLLRLLGDAAALSPELAQAMLRPAPEGMELTPEELFVFVRLIVPKLTEAGVLVQLPSRWTKERKRVGLSLKMTEQESWNDGGQDRLPAGLGMEHLVSFQVEAALGGELITREELMRLAELNMPYIEFRGEWVEVDLKEIRQVLRYIKRQEQGQMDMGDWIHLAAHDEEDRMWKGIAILGMETTGLLSSLLEGEALHHVPKRTIPAALHGELRPYQERGYQWLSAMRELGFGVCLADDMGLGKTIQVITCLLDKLPKQVGPALIICPTSLLGNWQRELQRFAPDLSLYIHHGNRRLHDEALYEQVGSHQVILTTYHLVGRDGGELAKVRWGSIVLDEAQYIKNYRTKQAQSVMKLSAPHRIAMTGTPVENRLGELWSIFHFLNPGYLGTSSSFRQRYATGDGQQERLQQLHRLVSPFMLRRLKSDPDIRKDLPEKIELKSYCTLSEVQGAMYQSVVDEMLGQIEQQSGMARKGMVLSSLTKLKQICDHPQLLNQASAAAAKSETSGKMERLFELLDSIAEHGEAALIFTQYVSMGHILVSQLTQRYGQKPKFLHGGISKQERDEMVSAFQKSEGPEFFVLSLKAGGVGLNLTRANHVLHYDRWWNPAVENQATDRVFRIGQERNVQVHKLICQGTLEERIDELIEQKKALSDLVVGSGEAWLTEMSNEELKELITLQNAEWM